MLENNWISYHLFVNDHAATENIVGTDLPVLIDELTQLNYITSWFYLRYWEGGPHIRLRLKKSVNFDVEFVQEKIEAIINKYENLLDKSISKIDFYRFHKFDGVKQNINDLPWFVPGQVVEIPYMPEYSRYGGVDAMSVNENVFNISSILASEIVRVTNDDASKRFLIALQLYLIALAAIGFSTKKDVLNFSSRYGQFWKSFIDDEEVKRHRISIDYKKNESIFSAVINNALAFSAVVNLNNHDLQRSSITTKWYVAVTDLVAELKRLAEKQQLINPFLNSVAVSDADIKAATIAVVSSQIHMLNNRLGVSPQQEWEITAYLNEWFERQEVAENV